MADWSALENAAVMITWFHWDVTVAYAAMGLVLALMSFRRSLPMTIRYCFWSLRGGR